MALFHRYSTQKRHGPGDRPRSADSASLNAGVREPLACRAVDRRPPLRALAGLGLVAGSTLALQVLLTRILSAALAYHFGFLAVSLALLGVGVGALVVYLRPAWFAKPLETLLARWSVALALLLIVVPAALVRLDFVTGEGGKVTAGFALTLALTCVLAALPFGAAGVVVALAVRGWTASIGRVYAFDLTGAGLGALLVVPLMWIASAPTLAVGLAAVVAIAALLFGGAPRAAPAPLRRPPRRWRWPAAPRPTSCRRPPARPASRRSATAGRRSAACSATRRSRARTSRCCSTTGSTRRCPCGAARSCRTGATCGSGRRASPTSCGPAGARW